MLCSKCTKLLIDDGTETTEVPDYILLPNPKSIPKPIPNTLLNISHTFFISDNLSYAEQYPYISIKTFNITMQNIDTVSCLYIHNKSPLVNPSQIIIFSQSEDTNISSILPTLIHLSTLLKLNIITYEYSLTHNNEEYAPYKDTSLISNITNVTSYVASIPYINTISLMGVSLGAYANLNVLIEHFHFNNISVLQKIKHIALIAPKWVYSVNFLKKGEHSRELRIRINQMKEVLKRKEIPTLVIHGKKDDVIKPYMTYSMCEGLPKLMEWYPKQGDHYNLMEGKYLKKMSLYLRGCFVYDNMQVLENKGIDGQKGVYASSYGLSSSSGSLVGSGSDIMFGGSVIETDEMFTGNFNVVPSGSGNNMGGTHLNNNNLTLGGATFKVNNPYINNSGNGGWDVFGNKKFIEDFQKEITSSINESRESFVKDDFSFHDPVH